MGNLPGMSDATYDQMRAAIDGGMNGVSFSGADITAVVYLPIDAAQKDKELKAAMKEAEKLEKAIAELEGIYNRYYTEKDNLQKSINSLFVEQSAFVPGSDMWLWYENEINTEKQRLTNTEKEIYTNKGYKTISQIPVALERLRDKLKAVNNYIHSSPSGFAKLGGNTESYIKPVILGDLQTITYSSHREKFPVRTLGRVLPKSYTRGPRTIAGSMIFTVINKHSLWELIKYYSRYMNTGVKGSDSFWGDYNAITVDQLPPFDITLLFSNEYGDNSYMVLYGVELINEGQTMSIQDLLTENVMQFVARDIDPLRPIEDRRRILNDTGTNQLTGDSLLKKRKSKERQAKRMNPFI